MRVEWHAQARSTQGTYMLEEGSQKAVHAAVGLSNPFFIALPHDATFGAGYQATGRLMGLKKKKKKRSI